jgi:hypothetical protein
MIMANEKTPKPEYVNEWGAGPVKYKQRRDGTVDMEYSYSQYAPPIPMGSTKMTGKKQKYSGWGLFDNVSNVAKGFLGKKTRPALPTVATVRTPGRVTNPLETSSETAQPVTLDELLGLGADSPTTASGDLYTGEEVSPVDMSRFFSSFLGSGGGGGGGMTAKEQFELEQAKASQRALNRYARNLQNVLDTGSYRTGQDELLNLLSQQYGASTPVINTAVDALKAQIAGQVNPYANIQAEATQVTPQLQQLLESQGVSTTPLQEFATTLQSQSEGQAAAFNNLAQQLAAGFEGSRTGQMTGAESQRAALLGALENARNLYSSQIESQALQRRQNIEQLLLDAIAKGGNPRKKNRNRGNN